jgi:hypothetical protein
MPGVRSKLMSAASKQERVPASDIERAKTRKVRPFGYAFTNFGIETIVDLIKIRRAIPARERT